MSMKLDDFKINEILTKEQLTAKVDALNFLELTGRKAKWSQGYKGKGIVIAVLDTGVMPHEEFENRLLPGYNAIEGYGNKSWYDDNCHGTHVAGSIAGKTVGVAPEAEILPVKVLRSDGSGEWPDLVRALNWVKNWRGADGKKKATIISMSLSGAANQITEQEKIDLEKAINECVAAGILVVVSAGNSGFEENRYPACFPAVVCVGAVDPDKKIAEFSTRGSQVDLCQVGVNVVSCWIDGGYADMSGTSMSTPLTSGIAGVVQSEHLARFKEYMPEPKSYEALKMYTKDLGITGADKVYGVGFCTLQPLNLTIEVEQGSNIIKFNGVPVTVDVAVQMINGRTMFPLRSFAEVTGTKVSWEAENEVHKTKATFVW